MKYVVTFETYDSDVGSGAVSFVADAPYVEYAVQEAAEKAEREGYNFNDCDILSVVRI